MQKPRAKTALLLMLLGGLALPDAAHADLGRGPAALDAPFDDDLDDDFVDDDLFDVDDDEGPRVSQGGGGRRADRRGPDGKRGRLSPEERQQLREEVGRRMDTFITVELATELELSDDKALKLADVVKAHREKQKGRREAVRAEHQKLKELVEGGAKDAELKAQTQKVIAMGKDARDLEGLFKETEKVLTAKEQAKLVIAYPKIARKMKRMVSRARKERRGGPF